MVAPSSLFTSRKQINFMKGHGSHGAFPRDVDEVFTSSTGLNDDSLSHHKRLMMNEISNLLATPESREPSRGNERDGRSSL